ncbi:hypothetical protein S7335_3257 [Synechococcus sp. PCC 7335]|uniref:hypothetical protein n=1 Tax=Synechococcus sp. (strain ATCC 29403 / PCC 7335) TaxID=91464 RepID=UPI00017EE0E2|nr:hypothetical protein [Synechococcus sp. PCC 7335]EDX85556.1 hypothetical protein S7335_3257 [Synechococcus sp. PCC 7335]
MVFNSKAFLSGVSSKATTSIAALSAISAIALPAALPLSAWAQMSDAVNPDADTQPTTAMPTVTRAVEQATSPIGIAAGQALMSEAEVAISAQDYTLAATKLVEARQALNDVSAHYQSLSSVFVGLDSRVNQDLRALALESAQVRDQASYQLAVVYRAQDRPDLAVPLLVEVVKSQQPTRDLGQQAYQQLYELGFVGVAYNTPS